MSNAFEAFPDNMRPVTDPRFIAAELSYAHWLVQITFGLVSEEKEDAYQKPIADDFTMEEARKIVQDFWHWAFENNDGGLLERANFESTRMLLGRSAVLASQIPGLDIASAKSAYDALVNLNSQIGMEYDASRPMFADHGDMDLLKELQTISFAQSIVRELIDADGSSIKEVLLSGRLDQGWTKIFDKDTQD